MKFAEQERQHGDHGPDDDIQERENKGRDDPHPEPRITVIVNGRPKHLTANTLSFDQVVHLAFDPVPSGPNILFTISYDNGPRENPEGSLLEGGVVKIKSGMVFNVTATDKS